MNRNKGSSKQVTPALELRTTTRNFDMRNKFFCLVCGGSSCRNENWLIHPNPALKGLNSSWVTENIIASQRLTTRIIKEFNLLEEFQKHNITNVINLQLPGEHPFCGDGLKPGEDFSYTQADLPGIKVHNLGWLDMDIPTTSQMITIVQLISVIISKNEKLIIHCHAGYGRTGSAIAAHLIYSTNMNDIDAVEFVRSKRKKSIQRRSQCNFLKKFYEYITRIRVLYPINPISIHDFFANQLILTYGKEGVKLKGVPKILIQLYSHIFELVETQKFTSEQICLAFCDPDNAVFQSKEYKELIDENTDCSVDSKVFTRKEELNSGIWRLKKELDPRVLAQLALL
mmetsp:Transcript_30956/g.30605  ORF Transcript_30956/g.30605 Transcript_30956/m.30605 type:complete len:342 (+) Transcript_30956:2-1027(+)